MIPHLGARQLQELTAAQVEAWLQLLRSELSTRTIQIARSCLSRSVRRAMQRDLVRRNVVELTEVPTGRPGRTSKAFTPELADAVLRETRADRFHAFIVVSMLTGARTEELRALRWTHVHLHADPPFVEVWRSVRAGGDTKTRRSRRTIALPDRCVDALRLEAERQDHDRELAGSGMAGDGPGLHELGGHRTGCRQRSSLPSGVLWLACQESSRASGRRGSCGTRSCRSCLTLGYRSRRLLVWSVIAAPRSPNWCTGTSCGQ